MPPLLFVAYFLVIVSRSFTDAIKDVQNNFSHGVHTLEESVQTYYQVCSS